MHSLRRAQAYRHAARRAHTLARLFSSSHTTPPPPPALPHIRPPAFLTPTVGHRPKRVLGVETSCDDTALAIIDTGGQVLSHATASQWSLFDRFHGVQPAHAAEAHAAAVDSVFAEVLTKANLSADDIDGVAVTAGPGMAPCLKVGIGWASKFASSRRLPFIGVHHMLAHAMVAALEEPLEKPFLALLISGGHTELWLVEPSGVTILSHSVDDAIGEAFDKAARVIGIRREEGRSPGATIELLAQKPIRHRHIFPVLDRRHTDFSFSGLKAALQRKVLEMKLEIAQRQQQHQQTSTIDDDNQSLSPTSSFSSSSPSSSSSPPFPSRLSNDLVRRFVRASKNDLFRDSNDGVEREDDPNMKLPPLPLQDQIDLAHAFQDALIQQLTMRVEIGLKYLAQTRPNLQLRQLVVAGGVACNMAIRHALESTISRWSIRLVAPRRLHCMDNGIMIAHLGMRELQSGHSDSYDICFHTRWPIGEKITMKLEKKDEKKKNKKNYKNVVADVRRSNTNNEGVTTRRSS